MSGSGSSELRSQRSLWSHLRALLVAAHLLAIAIHATPRVGRSVMAKSSLNSPTAKAELQAWSMRLEGAGLDLSPEEIGEVGRSLLKRWLKLRSGLTAPSEPYIKAFGLGQPWMLFPGADLRPRRLHLELEEKGRWRPLRTFYGQPPEAPSGWEALRFDHTRLRGLVFAVSWPSYEHRYRELGRWFARRAASDFPGATRLRMSLVSTPTPSAAQWRAGASLESQVRSARKYRLERHR